MKNSLRQSRGTPSSPRSKGTAKKTTDKPATKTTKTTKKTVTKAIKIEMVPIKHREKPTLSKQIETVKMLVRAVAMGRKDMQLICSEPGIGKTTIVMQELKKCGVKIEPQNPDNINAFVKCLYDHRNSPVIVFDDCDKLLRNEGIANTAKMAFGPTRQVIFQTVEARKNERRIGEDEDDYKARRDSSIPPTRFKIKCRLLWLSNFDCTRDDVAADKMSPHFRALISRGLDPIWIVSSGSPEKDLELFLYTLNLAPKMMSNMTLAQTQLTINWYARHRNYMREICPRAVSHIARQFKSLDAAEADYILENSLLMPTRQRNIPEAVVPKFVKSNIWTEATIKAQEQAPAPLKAIAKRAPAAKKSATAAKAKGFKTRSTTKK